MATALTQQKHDLDPEAPVASKVIDKAAPSAESRHGFAYNKRGPIPQSIALPTSVKLSTSLTNVWIQACIKAPYPPTTCLMMEVRRTPKWNQQSWHRNNIQPNSLNV